MAPFVLVAVSIAAVVAFVLASVRSSDRYSDSLQEPNELRRADDGRDASGGAPNGGPIWPGQ